MITLTFKQEDIQKISEKLRSMTEQKPGSVLYRGFSSATMMVERALKDNITGNFLKVRSGRLRGSIGSIVLAGRRGLEGEIGSGVRQGQRVVYANILETGGTIVPKRAKFLTIPIGQALKNSGVPRFSARDLIGGLTKYHGSFVAKGVMFGVTGKRNKAVPLFLLKKSVTIPAKHWMSKTLDKTSSLVVDTILNEFDKKDKQ